MKYPACRVGFILLVILAVLVRALIPVGFMPDSGSDKVAITICHGAEIATIFVDASDQPTEKTTQKDCAFTPIAQSNVGVGQPIILSVQAIKYTQIAYGLVQETGNAAYTHQPGQPRAPPIIL